MTYEQLKEGQRHNLALLVCGDLTLDEAEEFITHDWCEYINGKLEETTSKIDDAIYDAIGLKNDC